jgi:hypothetical protein
MIQFLMDDALGNKRSNYVVAFDCRDAFDSVSHKLLEIKLRNFSNYENLNEMIIDGYTNTSTTIMLQATSTDMIIIEREVKQGCPLSAFLFNICINPIFCYMKREFAGK